MLLCIREWYGRLGNNILQVRNVLLIALYYRCNVFLPTHSFFNKNLVLLFDDGGPNDSIYVDDDGSDFFYRDLLSKFAPAFSVGNDGIMNQIVRELFVLPETDMQPLGPDDLVIHIRSGDIFSDDPLPFYIMPPLSYYREILESRTYTNVYMLAEDTRNPCISSLLALYPDIKFHIQSLEEDVAMVLRATNIVMAFGTFVPALLCLTDNATVVHVPSYICTTTRGLLEQKGCDICVHDLDKYTAVMGPWQNRPEQRNLMLTFENKQT